MAAWRKGVERGPRALLVEILLGLFQIEVPSVQMFKNNLTTTKLEMLE